MKLLKKACESIGKNLKKNTIIIFESTVYPGVTEEICMPLIERHSSLKWMKDFNIAYSPERINPGDKTKSLANIEKVVSGDTKSTRTKLQNYIQKLLTKKFI